MAAASISAAPVVVAAGPRGCASSGWPVLPGPARLAMVSWSRSVCRTVTTCGTDDFVVRSCALRVDVSHPRPDLSVRARELGVNDGGRLMGCGRVHGNGRHSGPLGFFFFGKIQGWAIPCVLESVVTEAQGGILRYFYI